MVVCHLCIMIWYLFGQTFIILIGSVKLAEAINDELEDFYAAIDEPGIDEDQNTVEE